MGKYNVEYDDESGATYIFLVPPDRFPEKVVTVELRRPESFVVLNIDEDLDGNPVGVEII